MSLNMSIFSGLTLFAAAFLVLAALGGVEQSKSSCMQNSPQSSETCEFYIH